MDSAGGGRPDSDFDKLYASTPGAKKRLRP